MSKILVCIDQSDYTQHVCKKAAWIAEKTGADIDLLHVLNQHFDYSAPASDHTGSMSMDERTQLTKELTKIDEERASIDQKKGRQILEHGKQLLLKYGANNVNILYRRGKLTDTIKELESDAELIVLGKRKNQDQKDISSKLEDIARVTSKPLFIVSCKPMATDRFLIAYDDNKNAKQAIEYIGTSKLFQKMQCHLLTKSTCSKDIQKKLKSAQINIEKTTNSDEDLRELIVDYVKKHDIACVLIGAYNHSKIHDLIFGSTTNNLIKKCKTSFLLFSKS